jgi:SAM-dependent methyltransferase
MTGADYRTIVGHYEGCLERHGDTHLGVDWPDPDDADLRHRIMLDVVRNATEGTPATLLDLGCGAAHMVDYMRRNDVRGIEYTGLDLSPRFVELCREKFPDLTFHHLDVLEDGDVLPSFDYVVLNGVFTEKLGLDHDAMFAYFCAMIRTVFAKTRVAMAFNVMSTHVDWERDDLFHVAYDRMAEFLSREVSRHIVFRADYGLYEYTTYVYRSPIGEGSSGQ